MFSLLPPLFLISLSSSLPPIHLSSLSPPPPLPPISHLCGWLQRGPRLLQGSGGVCVPAGLAGRALRRVCASPWLPPRDVPAALAVQLQGGLGGPVLQPRWVEPPHASASMSAPPPGTRWCCRSGRSHPSPEAPNSLLQQHTHA